MSKILFVIGVNGIGKSTVIPILKKKLNSESFAIHDFDERGVPDSAGREWRQAETLHWMQSGKENLENNISTIICGYSKPAEVAVAADECGVQPSVILLDADAETISQRIMSRYQNQENIDELIRTTEKTPEKFVQDNVWVASKFREDSIAQNYTIIDTSRLSPEEVAEKIIAVSELQ